MMSDPELLEVKIDTHPNNFHNISLGIVGEVRFRAFKDEIPICELCPSNDRVLCDLEHMSHIHFDQEFGWYVKPNGLATKLEHVETFHYIWKGN